MRSNVDETWTRGRSTPATCSQSEKSRSIYLFPLVDALRLDERLGELHTAAWTVHVRPRLGPVAGPPETRRRSGTYTPLCGHVSDAATRRTCVPLTHPPAWQRTTTTTTTEGTTHGTA
jgi:hypothetical protein